MPREHGELLPLARLCAVVVSSTSVLSDTGGSQGAESELIGPLRKQISIFDSVSRVHIWPLTPEYADFQVKQHKMTITVCVMYSDKFGTDQLPV